MPTPKVKSVVTTRQSTRKYTSTSKTSWSLAKKAKVNSNRSPPRETPTMSTLQVTITQPVLAQGANASVSSTLPHGVLQTSVVWSLTLGPLPTTATNLSNQTLPVWSAAQQPVWPATWNPSTGTYQQMAPTPPVQVPWMSTGITSAQWPQFQQNTNQQWASTTQQQPSQPVQTWVPVMQQQNLATPVQQPPPQVIMQQLTQILQPQGAPNLQQQVPVAAVTTPAPPITGVQPAESQIIPLVIPRMVSQLNMSNLPGNTQSIISAHVPLTIKNKVWSYMYVDLGPF